MKSRYLFLEPIDVLYLRGNRLFGEAGEHAEAQMPPWPSLFAGAIRSRILVDQNVDLTRFAAGEADDARVGEVLGTPDNPGSFRISFVSLCRMTSRGLEPVFPLPADLIALEADARESKAALNLLQPAELNSLAPLSMSSPLQSAPLLRVPGGGKPLAGKWLDRKGFVSYLRSDAPSPESLLSQHSLWETDARLGIGLDAGRRVAAQGRIYTTDAVAFKKGVGFLVGIAGSDGILPADGLLRLGGDGRGASLAEVEVEESWKIIPQGPRFRMILSTPGIFPGGWLPPGVVERHDGFLLDFMGLKARLLAAAVPRHQVVSGWDIARRCPKPAERVVPPGSVYWFERVDGDMSALGELLDKGLWPLMGREKEGGGDCPIDPQRRAEGFNSVYFGQW